VNLLDQVKDLEFPAPLPPALLEIEQRFAAPCVDDVAAAVARALDAAPLRSILRPGATLAVGVGSRGIASLPLIVRATLDWLKAQGCAPFIVPAMGSHGGATAAGQIDVLAALGVTEAAMNAPVRATMEVDEIGAVEGVPLYQGRDSRAADHTILVSRIKPHTDFRGRFESGPAKMCVIGLGKRRGAEAMHVGGAANFQRYLGPAAHVYATQTNLAGALCLVENAHEQTAHVEFLDPGQIGAQREAELLEVAADNFARLPFAAVDVLVVREIGKNVSGTGFDTNVISRLHIPRMAEDFGVTDIAIIALLDLTPETEGAASGIGLANFCTARAARKVDWVKTYTNAVTAGIFGAARHSQPITLWGDRRIIMAAVRCCGRPAAEARFVFIPDTLHLDRLWVSPNLRAEVEAHSRLRVLGETPLAFDAQGTMTSPWTLTPDGKDYSSAITVGRASQPDNPQHP
jgi:hypothetical protein